MVSTTTSSQSPTSVAFVLGLLAFSGFLIPQANANVFRGGRISDMASQGSPSPELESALLKEIEEVLGSEHRQATEKRLARIEAVLKPMYASLPKNEHGRLGHAAVRYAMHRLFVQRHGWFIRGLDPRGEAENTSTSPTIILEDRMPAYVQSLFEKRVGGHGFDLHELAVMGATLENLVHKEAMDRLEHTYKALDFSLQDPVSVEESHDIIDTFMIAYILGTNFTSMEPKGVTQLHAQIKESYPTWPHTQKFLREVQEFTSPAKREELSYEHVASIVEEVGERYGRWQDNECQDLKKDLVLAEDKQKGGRVRMSDFYGMAVKQGKWQFGESVDYLRMLGALDETDPSNPSVIIPNYISSPTNCLAASSYYSVCCLDECEDILGHIEEQIGAEDAAPAEILAIVAKLPSATTAGNRKLSPMVIKHLEEAAAYHGGRIPLHGRLFAQWLHVAYPRECIYPHASGNVIRSGRTQFANMTGKDAGASVDDMMKYIDPAQRSASDSDASSQARFRSGKEEEEHHMWTLEEELFVVRPSTPAPSRRSSSLTTLVRGIVFVALIVSFSLVLKQNFGVAMSKKSLLPTYHNSKYL
jgi:hypothetical protein